MQPAVEIVSVNVGRAETIGFGSHSVTTGIRKRPVTEAVLIGEFGLDGDAIVDTRHHGGKDQAVYAYGLEDYQWWAESTGREFGPGLFGENLTLRGLPSDLSIGDRILIGDVVLEATSPRIPCGTLATRMQDRGFGLAFRKAARPGVYFRVLNSGQVRAGDRVEIVNCGSPAVTVLDLFRFAYATGHDAERLEEILDAPVAERFRARVETALERIRQR